MKTSTAIKTYHFTSTELNQVRDYYLKRKVQLNEVIQAFSSVKYSQYDIFLTHRSTDKELIDILFLELKSDTYNVYVDWYDPELNRDDITEKSAELIRLSIRKSKCLIYATPVSDDMSKWMPWECGYMDGYSGNVAILPIMEEPDMKFKGQEFLGLYPLIKKGEDNKLYVVFSDGRIILFDDWIAKVPATRNEIFNTYMIQQEQIEKNPLQGIGTINLKNNIKFL